MPDDVWPLPAAEPPMLNTFNGTGLELKGFTRADAAGRCFATRWLVLLGMPIIPLGRYYLRQGSTTGFASGSYTEYRTRYAIEGRARPRFFEIIRTYVFCWLIGPGVVLAPTLALLWRVDELSDAIAPDSGWSFLAVTALALGWPVSAIVLLVMLLQNYRKHWAPVRTARRLTKPPPASS